MLVQHGRPEVGFTADRSSFREWGALVSAAFLLVLPGTGATHGADDHQAEPSSSSGTSSGASSEEGDRPAWLRPIPDAADSSIKPEKAGRDSYRDGWSELEPGVLDVQAWDWLTQDLDRMLDLITAHGSNRLSPEAFEAKFVDATAKFLEFDADETEVFQAAVKRALDEIEAARAEMLRQKSTAKPDRDETTAMLASRASWGVYSEAQHHAVRYPLGVLQQRPRHELLREGMLKWLLRLKFGMGAAAT